MPQTPRLHLGAACYPEHWPESRWPEDVRLMKETGLSVVRLGEFAWSSLEPEPGRFNFGWLDRFLGLLGGAGISAVMGTPTAAPPAWLSQGDVLAVGEDGRRVQFGNRCHYCVNSPAFHDAVRRLVEAMAGHFGPHPGIIGWQIDNEFNRICHCDTCRRLFQKFLRDKFGTLDELNARWSTAYWSQTYSDWRQIPLPEGRHNPGLMLEFMNFVSRSYQNFQGLQVSLLRPHLRPDVWITHNFMGGAGCFDHYAQAEGLDLASWDAYVGTGHLNAPGMALAHDLVRGFKRRNFWLMETQPGHVNWASVNNELDRGEARALAWQAVGHGADAVLYWQWRCAPGGQEQYHGSLLDQSGRPRPFCEEVRQLGGELEKVSPLLAGTAVRASVAVLNSYQDRWAVDWQRHAEGFDYMQHLGHYARPLAARSVAMDIISADADPAGYKLVIAPALYLLDGARAARLAAYVEGGGNLVLTLRSGMKDGFNALLPMRPPGPLSAAAGVEVEDYYALTDGEPVALTGARLRGTARIWAERLKVTDPATEVLARYGRSNGWLDEQPAVTVHPHGGGRVWYVGAYLDDRAQQTLLEHVCAKTGIKPVLPMPTGIEACRRVAADGREVFILINHTRTAQKMTLPWQAQEHLTGNTIYALLTLPACGAAVLTRT